MKVYSGTYCMCDAGTPTGETDMRGQDLFTGDIVQLWHGMWIGEEFEEWHPTDGLTAIVSDQYTCYSNGKAIENPDPRTFYTMGIKSSGVHDAEWKVRLIKSHKDIIPGERIVSYGFTWK